MTAEISVRSNSGGLGGSGGKEKEGDPGAAAGPSDKEIFTKHISGNIFLLAFVWQAWCLGPAG